MIDPASLAFDIDGVIADTMTLFLDIARTEFGIEHVGYDDITSYTLEECLNLDPAVVQAVVARLLDGSYEGTLHSLPGAARVLTRIGRRTHGLVLVTARPHPGPMSGWITDLLKPAQTPFEIVATGSFDTKAEVLRQRRISHFVEDRLETCFLLHSAGIAPVLFKQPWNRARHPFVEVDSWTALEKLIDF
jgi:uncharacterized HAD superfamily protein